MKIKKNVAIEALAEMKQAVEASQFISHDHSLMQEFMLSELEARLDTMLDLVNTHYR